MLKMLCIYTSLCFVVSHILKTSHCKRELVVYDIAIYEYTHLLTFSQKMAIKSLKYVAESCKFIIYSIKSCVKLYFITLFN